MIYAFIILISVLQLLVYKFLNKNRLGKWKLVVLLILLSGHFLWFPQWFYPQGASECGMPIFAIIILFMVLGGGLALLTHLGNYLFERKIKRKNYEV